ncbi:MAG: aldo/keto reductase [Nonlabens sp.]|nr:aldo/keto reductase [Nonlabens sp.]
MIALSDSLSLSRIVHGMWRLNDWNMSSEELRHFVHQAMDLGITTFDHADIYGNHTCEALFGNAVGDDKALRDSMQLVTKCGIKLTTDKFPERKVKYYDYSESYIISQVEQSLENLKTDRIDLLLLHRPSPFMDGHEVASAFDKLHASGKVLHFGVSNFLPLQFDSLQSYVNQQLLTNQIELSVAALEHFENNNLDYLQAKRIKPMAWSPLAGGSLFHPKTEKEQRLQHILQEIAAENGIDSIDKVMYQWLLMHPAGILPIVGSGNIDRLQIAVDSLDVKLTNEQWFQIYIASQGHDLP